jgi:hypothetical protein
MKPNGHDKNAAAANGHALPASSREVCAPRLDHGGAASDDRRVFPSAAGAFAPAGMERDGCAELAPPGEAVRNRKHSGSRSGKNTHANKHAALHAPGGASEPEDASPIVDIPPGIKPLPSDGPGFVDAMHAHVDLYLACARLVKSADEKIAQRMVERLLEMSYGKSPAQSGEEAAPILFAARQAPSE